MHLSEAVHMWPTPRSSDREHGGPNQRGSKGDLALPSAVMFPTPRANKRGLPDSHGDVSAWATPTVRDSRSYKGSQVMPNHQGAETLIQQVGGQLNPCWVGWLMGLPIGWLSLEPLGTESYQQWWQDFCGRS